MPDSCVTPTLRLKPKGRAHTRLNLDPLAWCCRDNVTQMKATLTEQYGPLFENLLQRPREPLSSLADSVGIRSRLHRLRALPDHGMEILPEQQMLSSLD
jgi:hypothetical protein